GAATHATGRFATHVASRKDLARQVLAAAGLEVAEGRAFGPEGYEAAADYATQLGDVVVKPVDGNKGRGVTVGVRERDAFARAWRLAAGRSSVGVLVERRFSGIELRCLVVGDRCGAVLRRPPPSVVGNGPDTIEQLIAAKDRLRLQNPSLVKCDITMDPHRHDELRRQGYDLTSVLPEGHRVVLDHKGGISTGGESVDLTDDVHPSVKDVAVRATRAVPGLDVAGVDIITVDPQQPATAGSYVVCEINHDPGIDIHHFPVHGTPRDVAGAIVDHHLSQLGIAARRRGRRPGWRRGGGPGRARRRGPGQVAGSNPASSPAVNATGLLPSRSGLTAAASAARAAGPRAPTADRLGSRPSRRTSASNAARAAGPSGAPSRRRISAIARACTPRSTRRRRGSGSSWASMKAPSVRATAWPWLTPYRLVMAYDSACAPVVLEMSIARPARWLPTTMARAHRSSGA